MTEAKRIAIIGAGPGGYVAAIRAAQRGGRVTVVEKEALGGVCLNWGCIPSKALLSVVELGEKLKKAHDLGLVGGEQLGYDLARMVARKNKVVEGLVRGIGMLFKAWGIEHVQGTGELLDERTVRVVGQDGSEQRLEADAIVLATGSSWPNLAAFPVDGQQILTSRQLLDLTTVPKSLLIVGGGVEGCEFAALFQALGSAVTIVEMMPRLLPQEDEEVAAVLHRELKKRGVTIHTGTTVERLDCRPQSVAAQLNNGTALEIERILVSVGRGLNSTGLGLDKLGVQLGPRGQILVNERLETNVAGVYAIGDVVGQGMLAHVASTQGKVAVDNILGHSRRMDYTIVPAGIFTLPEIGRVGYTEQQARAERGETNVKVGRFRHVALGKAQAVGETTGLYKIVADARTGAVIGVHIVGSHAADLIHEAAIAMQLGATASDIADTIHAHPTLAEGMLEAAEDVDGLAVHVARKRA